MRKIVDVFVRDTLKGSYPVVIECEDRPGEDEFVDQVRNGLDRVFIRQTTSKPRGSSSVKVEGGKRL